MENFGLKDVIYIVTIVAATIGTFYATKHSIKEYVRDKIDYLKDKHNKLELEIEKVKSKLENQQTIVDEFKKQILNHLPDLFQIIKEKKNGNEK